MMRPAVAIPCVCLLLGACAPATQVILLPSPGHQPAAVEVSTAAAAITLTRPYEAATVSTGGRITSSAASASYVETRYGNLLAIAPSPAQRVVLYFEEQSAGLTENSRRELGAALRAANQRARMEITVVGHGGNDPTDTAAAKALTQERLRVVREFIAAYGFAAAPTIAADRDAWDPVRPAPAMRALPRHPDMEVTVR